MKRWSVGDLDRIEVPKADELINKIDELCKQYDFEIHHEDTGGSFILEEGYEDNSWFKDAALSLIKSDGERITDWTAKGNVVRFYLGKDIVDIAFPYNWKVTDNGDCLMAGLWEFRRGDSRQKINATGREWICV